MNLQHPRSIHRTSSARRQEAILVFMPALLQAGFFMFKCRYGLQPAMPLVLYQYHC